MWQTFVLQLATVAALTALVLHKDCGTDVWAIVVGGMTGVQFYSRGTRTGAALGTASMRPPPNQLSTILFIGGLSWAAIRILKG